MRYAVEVSGGPGLSGPESDVGEWLVYDEDRPDDDDTVICWCGRGPVAKENAERIAAALNSQ